MLNWDLPETDALLVHSIVSRARQCMLIMGAPAPDTLALTMDVTACHNHGCQLDLVGLSKAGDGDLVHDVIGISRHIDRSSGQLQSCFVPRFSREPFS